MEHMRTITLILFLLVTLAGNSTKAQSRVWTLDECIDYALDKSIDIQKARLSTGRSELNAAQALNNRLPSLTGSVRQNASWAKSYEGSTGNYGKLSGSSSTSFSLSSGVTLYNGLKLQNRIRQSNLDVESSRYYEETIKESVALNILDAFLQVLYATENVKNDLKQIEATTQQLDLARERLNLSVISTSDFLQIKSQLASEKLTLANAQNQLTLARVNLMQGMELPVMPDFEVAAPELATVLENKEIPLAQEVYNLALGIKPEVKNAELNSEASRLDVDMAKADLLPTLSLDAGLGTGYANGQTGSGYFDQLSNKITPSAGLSLSIPIFRNKQVRTNISLAQLSIADAELTEINTKNQLRKAIEQACADVIAARSEYLASQEQYMAISESNQVATDKYELGLINSVDFLFEKTNLIQSESQLLQAKYNLVFAHKVVDFYKGIPIRI